MSLLGKQILLTLNDETTHRWRQKIEEHGAIVHSHPAITLKASTINQKIHRQLAELYNYNWIVFTSPAGVRFFAQACKMRQLKIDSSILPPIAVIGNQTASTLQDFDLTPKFIAPKATSISLGRKLHEVQNKKILLLRTSIATSLLPNTLRQRGAIITDVAIYTTLTKVQEVKNIEAKLNKRSIDYQVFGSPSAVHGICQHLSRQNVSQIKQLPTVALGPTTAIALKKAGFTQIRIATHPTIHEVLQELSKFSAASA